MKSVLIATPCYNGQVQMGYMKSVIDTVVQGPSRGYQVEVLTNTDSLITRARNNAVALFLDGFWDYLFWIDSDISFDANQFFRILDAKRDIAAAAYPLKKLHWPAGATPLVGRDLEASLLRYAITLGEGDITIPPDGFIEVSEAATGFMCISRLTFETLIENFPGMQYRSDQEALGAPASQNHYLFFDTMVDGARYLSEDYAFCKRARGAGLSIWLDLHSELTHTGSFDYRGSIPDTNRAGQLVAAG